MVARISTGKSMLGALNYNENKVREGKANCIAENLFGCDVERLTLAAKQERFQHQMQLNRRSKTNVVHISLNFSKDDSLSNERLKEVAASYMERIGFGDQPYLVYNHFDAAHPHVHVLTTSIQSSGKRIPLHNLGRVKSEKARQEVEQLFDLTRAKGRNHSGSLFADVRAVDVVHYGKSETKSTISKVVQAVTRSYKYTSLPELNAVLKQFNVMADRGNEGTKMFAKKGLVYSIIDVNEKKVGVPIKASSIFGKPTLANLEKRFKLNEALRTPHKGRLQQVIHHALKDDARTSISDLVLELQRNNIVPVFRQSSDGRVFGVTFIDHQTRVVFKGSDLGKEYAAKALMEKLARGVGDTRKHQATAKKSCMPADTIRTPDRSADVHASMELVKNLLAPEKTNTAIEPSLIRKRRKKRRRRSF